MTVPISGSCTPCASVRYFVQQCFRRHGGLVASPTPGQGRAAFGHAFIPRQGPGGWLWAYNRMCLEC